MTRIFKIGPNPKQYAWPSDLCYLYKHQFLVNNGKNMQEGLKLPSLQIRRFVVQTKSRRISLGNHFRF